MYDRMLLKKTKSIRQKEIIFFYKQLQMPIFFLLLTDQRNSLPTDYSLIVLHKF